MYINTTDNTNKTIIMTTGSKLGYTPSGRDILFEIKEELIKSGEFVSKGIIWFAVIWSLLGGYGLITLISKFI